MVRTRFAPSPTGYLHIGGVRTALFNWLFARKHGGQFVLRIDDTDAQRNVGEALEPILHGFRWLGIDWDEGPGIEGPHAPYFQSRRQDSYTAAVQQLVACGAAYYDYAQPEEIQAERQAAEQQKRSFVYSRTWMAETEQEHATFQSQGREAVVRLKMPREGSLVINDLVRGEVKFDWAREQDHVIQRADGSCLYHLATVVDDRDFEISHVIRAEEHLSNTPRQVFIAKALGIDPPEFAHVPFVAEPASKNKLSKRKLDKYLKHRDFAKLNQLGTEIAAQLGSEISADTFNPVIVDFYEQIGFLPDALTNYLLLLGWSLDDKTEFFTREEMIANFSLARVNKSAASFDPQKLMAFQAHYMSKLPVKRKVASVLPFLQRAGYVESPMACSVGPQLTAIVEGAADRLVVAGDILAFEDFFRADDELVYDDKAFDKRLANAPESVELLRAFREVLAVTTPFEAGPLEVALKAFVEQQGIKIGQIIHALRVATTGKAVGFGMFETLEVLGYQRTLSRIDHTLQKLVK